MKIKKFGAIDIGSNAIRLLISNVIETPDEPTIFRKYSLIRVPIRLGQDVFTSGKVSDKNIQKMVDAMTSFKLLMNVHEVEKYRACATSAMREAENGDDIVKIIAEKSDINIEIIKGKDEANIIATNHLNNFMDNHKNYLYVDVGGGSTEFTIYQKGKATYSKSFKIGTIRLLNDTVSDEYWDDVQHWIKKHTHNLDNISLVGSGGNINKIFKTSRKKYGETLDLKYLKKFYKETLSYSIADRVRVLRMNQDRADVVTHACLIFINAMKWSKAKKILVPEIGLSDGIIKSIYSQEQ